MSSESSCHSLPRSGILDPFPPAPVCLLCLYFYIAMALVSYWLFIYSYCVVCLYFLTAELKRMHSLLAGKCNFLPPIGSDAYWFWYVLSWCVLVLMLAVLMYTVLTYGGPKMHLSWKRMYSAFFLRSPALSQRGEATSPQPDPAAFGSLQCSVHFVTLQQPSLWASPPQTISITSHTVSITSQTPWSRIPASSTGWHIWIFCFWRAWGTS